jgi:hypothetical protein
MWVQATAAARWWWEALGTLMVRIMTAASAAIMIADTMRAVLAVAARPVARWRTEASAEGMAAEGMAAAEDGKSLEAFKMNRTDKI